MLLTQVPSHVESFLNDIVAWVHDNMLKLNTDKSYCLFISTQTRKAMCLENVLMIVDHYDHV